MTSMSFYFDRRFPLIIYNLKKEKQKKGIEPEVGIAQDSLDLQNNPRSSVSSLWSGRTNTGHAFLWLFPGCVALNLTHAHFLWRQPSAQAPKPKSDSIKNKPPRQKIYHKGFEIFVMLNHNETGCNIKTCNYVMYISSVSMKTMGFAPIRKQEMIRKVARNHYTLFVYLMYQKLAMCPSS